jgi:hypothetical protein
MSDVQTTLALNDAVHDAVLLEGARDINYKSYDITKTLEKPTNDAPVQRIDVPFNNICVVFRHRETEHDKQVAEVIEMFQAAAMLSLLGATGLKNVQPRTWRLGITFDTPHIKLDEKTGLIQVRWAEGECTELAALQIAYQICAASGLLFDMYKHYRTPEQKILTAEMALARAFKF